MNRSWWEEPVAFLCDRWWMFLAVLGLVLLGYFTRTQWLPVLGLGTGTAAPAPVGTPASGDAAVFVDPEGDYRLVHRSDWVAKDLGEGVQQWTLPEGVVMSVHSEPMRATDALESWASEVVTRLPYEVITQSEASVGGEAAIRQEVANFGQSQRIAVGYLVLHGGEKYQIALAGLEGLSNADQEKLIADCERALATFAFES